LSNKQTLKSIYNNTNNRDEIENKIYTNFQSFDFKKDAKKSKSTLKNSNNNKNINYNYTSSSNNKNSKFDKSNSIQEKHGYNHHRNFRNYSAGN
jgi:hypothetical protein